MKFGKYHFCCRFETEAVMPGYKGSTFRGVFGRALKNVVCALNRQPCSTCLIRRHCLYAQLFEESASDETSPDGKNNSPRPHPFVIEPPADRRRHYPVHSDFNFQLLLFGRYTDFLPHFIYAIEQIGRFGIGKRINGNRGRFTLESVGCNGSTLYTCLSKQLVMPKKKQELSLELSPRPQTDAGRIRLELQTPLRFKIDNRLHSDLPFHILVRLMLRRMSSLFAWYGNETPPMDFQGLIEKAQSVKTAASDLRWFDWRRYSGRQKQSMKMGGLVGAVEYRGELGDYLPLLRFCETVHIGKQTTFGLGKMGVRIQ